jgi:hypothetical protein
MKGKSIKTLPSSSSSAGKVKCSIHGNDYPFQVPGKFCQQSFQPTDEISSLDTNDNLSPIAT